MSTVSAVLSLGFALVLARSGQARATDALVDFGGELLRVGDRQLSGAVESDVYRVSMNGQSLDVATAASGKPMTEVLSYFERECKTHGAGLSVRGLQATVDTMPAHEGPPSYWTMRAERGGRGFVACIAADHELSPKEKVDRLRKAAATSDLGDLGNIRYFAIEKVDGATRVVGSTTTGSFDLKKFAPASGDAEGLDFPDTPRPEGSRRILSASVDGAPAAIDLYTVDRPASVVRAEVDAALLSKGWSPGLKAPSIVEERGRAYTRGPFDLLVSVGESDAGKSGVSYAISRVLGTATVSR